MTRGLRQLVVNSALAVAAGFALSPVFGLLLPNQPFHRVMQRTAMITFILLFLRTAGHPRTWPGKVRDLGLRGPRRGGWFLYGFAVTAALMALLVVVSWGLGGLVPPEGAPRYSLAGHIVRAGLAATIVSFLEEILFRGYLLKTVGSIASALFYSLVHFFTPIERTAPAGADYDPLLAFKVFPRLLEQFADPRILTFGVLSLFLLGLALNTLRRRTGSLWACIGVHFGLVLLVKLHTRWFMLDPADPDKWIFGGGRLHDGLLGTLAIALLYVGALAAPLPRFMREDAGSPSPRPPRPRSEEAR